MAKKKPPANFTILPLEALGKGEFTVIGPIRLTHQKRIRCVPTPCRDGWHYCPDWYDLTEFG